MDRQISNIESFETNTHTIDYSELVKVVQLSAARLLDLPGAFEATSFEQLLVSYKPEDRESIICKVGAQFDDSLLSFITTAMIVHQPKKIVISTKETDGFNGVLPWKPKLEELTAALKKQRILNNPQCEVKPPSKATIEALTQQAELLAA